MYEIFLKLLKEHGVTAYKVGKDTGIGSSTFTDWKNGRSAPKQEKLQKIADYFGVSIDYLLNGDEKDAPEQYYIDDQTAKIAQELLENKELKMLMDVSKNAKPERLLAYYNMIKELEKQEND